MDFGIYCSLIYFCPFIFPLWGCSKCHSECQPGCAQLPLLRIGQTICPGWRDLYRRRFCRWTFDVWGDGKDRGEAREREGPSTEPTTAAATVSPIIVVADPGIGTIFTLHLTIQAIGRWSGLFTFFLSKNNTLLYFLIWIFFPYYSLPMNDYNLKIIIALSLDFLLYEGVTSLIFQRILKNYA